MMLSAPLYLLKRRARLLSRKRNIPLHQALNMIAVEEGYNDWSLLVMKQAETLSADGLFRQLRPGDMVLLGARPGQGKTLLSLELLISAVESGKQGVFFTLEYTEQDVLQRLKKLRPEWQSSNDLFVFDGSDAISADYIIARMAAAPHGAYIVIDYLQILDQRRDKPDLAEQVAALKSFAQQKDFILIFISQIDRFYDPVKKPCPDMHDIRLPNPLELTFFNKMCFVQGDKIRLSRFGQSG
ncbi:DNA helicase [Ochrobactrum sp. SFR4]|uniref:DNA helicase n=1 Tax=Ochrobactrum sp. SFR4 TaxID=2717368 RepID=UPI000EFC2F6B|nr:DNA helicase [Ochrobactrum sp. SFR4]MBX8826299.1 AAA family ATPase [Ochrobactrum sp. SFR4]